MGHVPTWFRLTLISKQFREVDSGFVSTGSAIRRLAGIGPRVFQFQASRLGSLLWPVRAAVGINGRNRNGLFLCIPIVVIVI